MISIQHLASKARAGLAAALLGIATQAFGQVILWEAYNDHRPDVDLTHPNATGYDIRATDEGGILRDFRTGADLPVTLVVLVEGNDHR